MRVSSRSTLVALALLGFGAAACAMPRAEKSAEQAQPTAADAASDAVAVDAEEQRFADPPPEAEPVESAGRLARTDPLGELDRLERELAQIGLPVGRYRDKSRPATTTATGERPGAGKAGGGSVSQAPRPSAPSATSKPSKDLEAGLIEPKREDKKPKPKKKGKKSKEKNDVADGYGRGGDDDMKQESEKENSEVARGVGGIVVGGGVEMDVGARCEAVCEIAEAICELEAQICELSNEHPEDERYAEACERAGDDCREASRECTACAG